MKTMQHSFVNSIPDQTEPDVLYISLLYNTAIHQCACGCGSEVVTPLSPTDWEMRYNGAGVSLHPSIGNWNFPCRSHYWITRGKIHWAGKWSEKEIEEGRKRDMKRKIDAYGELDEQPEENVAPIEKPLTEHEKQPWWRRLAISLGIKF